MGAKLGDKKEEALTGISALLDEESLNDREAECND